MSRLIKSVAVIGTGTMGAGIAAASAAAGCRVLMLDITEEAVNGALGQINEADLHLVSTGTIENDLPKIYDYDWVCEAIVEDVEIKRSLFLKLEDHRREKSVISSNTSGIPLSQLSEGMPERFCEDFAITHFFNPVKVMKLFELVPGKETAPDVIEAFSRFGSETLQKGVVHAKDTVNFIGNRIGCFFILSGFHLAKKYLNDGIRQETIDAVLSTPVGLPPTGLYGLVDLIGLDVMELVGRNLAVNLPKEDKGHMFTSFPSVEQSMHDRGQLGRKSGGGFARQIKLADGTREKEVFDLLNEEWRTADPSDEVGLSVGLGEILFQDSLLGQLAWEIFGGTLLYAADLVPEIADDIVNVDNAIKWGFNWVHGPFEMLDYLGPERVIGRLESENVPLPRMLLALKESGGRYFYDHSTSSYLGADGRYAPIQ